MKEKKILTRLWSILLILAMLVGLLPTTALAEGSATATANFSDPTTALALLNTYKTGEADSTWDADSKTLTLNGVNFETTAATAVQLPDGAKITLADGTTNTIKGGDAATGDCYGIYGVGSLTIQGTGTLDVTSGTSTSNLSFGIHAQGSVTINSGAVTATGGAALNGQNGQSFGIRALNNALTITGGTVTATGSDAKISSNGLWAGDGSVTISGGTVVAESGRVTGVGASSGIYAKNVEINNTGTIVTATSGTAQRGTSYGINAVSGGTVTFSGGTLTAATKGDSCIKGTFNAAGKTISFDSNDGVGNMMARTTAAEYTLPANGFTPPAGKQLKGWAASENGDVISGPITVDGDKTLYAIWEDIKYTVTFDANGGKVNDKNTDTAATTAAGKLSTLPTPTRDGYTFKEWNTEQNGTGTKVTSETTFTENTTVYAQWEVATVPITSVAITGIDAPVSNTALDTEADCNTTGVSNAKPTVTWTPSDTKAHYGEAYTASVTLTAAAGKAFADETTATVNGNPATRVTKNADGTLTVTYTFPATAKHNIEITVKTDVRGGDAAKNPTISSGYEFALCVFPEDTNGDGDFTRDLTWVIDKDLLKEFAEQHGKTLEEVIAALKNDGLTVKTEFTAGYKYSVYARIQHSDGAEFTYNNNTDYLVTNAIVKVNGKDITAVCKKNPNSDVIYFLPSTDIIVFTAGTPTPTTPTYTPPTYKVESTVSEDADGSVSFSKNSAKKGDTVTITVTPDRYYKTSGVIVKDASGRMIAVTDNGNGTFTFQMPDSKVTVEPVFSWDNPFVDVAGDAYYAPAVEWALKNEVTDGTSDTTFSPDAGCTRGQIVTFLWRAAGCPEPAGISSFTDVSADAYYAKAVAWAVEQGITDGTGDGKFSPDAVCTRGQIVTFLWRAEKSPAVGTANPFTDVEADAYYAGATNWAVENGITEGTGDGTTFSPANDCTRAQIVAFLYRYFVK